MENDVALQASAVDLLLTGTLAVARPFGFLLLFPVFGWMGLTPLIRLAIALAIALPVLSRTDPGAMVADAGYAILLVKELAVGAGIGIALGVPFWAAETAGSYIDQSRGAAAAVVTSPDGSSQPLVTGAVLTLALIAIFLVAGGLRASIGAVYISVEIWPVDSVVPPDAVEFRALILGVLAQVFALALALAAPVLIALFLGDLLIGTLGRLTGQPSLFDTSLAVKNLIFLLILPLYLYALTTRYADDLLGGDLLSGVLARMATP